MGQAAGARRAIVIGAASMVGILVLTLVLSQLRGSDAAGLRSAHTDRNPPSALIAVAGHYSVPASYYGVNAGLAFAGSPRTWVAAAAQIARLGVGAVRRDAFWSSVEPNQPRRGLHTYLWHSTDELVAALAESHLRWYPIVDYATSWAGVSGWESPPKAADVGDYAAFAGALARRYGSRGSFWRNHPRLPKMPVEAYEIWNEPNFAHFWPDQSYAPRRLGAMYLAAQALIKAADPSGRVVLGGLNPEGASDFVTRLMAAQPRLNIHLEAIGFHPYGGGPDGDLEITYERIRALRRLLDHLVPARYIPIEITETGWAVPWTPETWRSARLQALAIELPHSNCDITRLIVYDWISTDTGSSPEGYFGIATPDGTPTASALAFGAGIATAREAAVKSAPTFQIC
jgi:hypothetical protein